VGKISVYVKIVIENLKKENMNIKETVCMVFHLAVYLRAEIIGKLVQGKR